MPLLCSMTSKLDNIMSTSDSGSFPVTNTLSDSPDFVSGILDPRILARMANEFFSALPETGTVPAAPTPVDPTIASPVTAPVTASVPAFPPEVSLPSDPHFASAPASAGAASASPVTAPAVTSPPAVPAGTASVVPAEPPAAFSFLQEARPLFGASDPAPSPYPEARPIIEFVDSEPHPIAEPSAAEQKSMPLATDFTQPPSLTVPASFAPVDSSAIPAFTFLEEARPLFSTTPSVPGPVPAPLRTKDRQPVPPAESKPDTPGSPALPFSFIRESRPIAPVENAPAGEPLGIEPDVSRDLNLSSYSFDAEALRGDFPILRERVNGRPLVWLDNAATTQKPQSVIDRLNYYYEHENSNVHRAAHELAARATDAYESAREKVRRFLNASSSREIVFVRGATEGINLIAQSWGWQNIQKDDEIVITWLEHHANIVPWQMLCSEKGAHLRVAPVDSTGQVLLDEYEKLLGPRTRLVAFPQVSNALGVVTPAQAIIEAAHRHGARVLLDGAQSVSHMRVDVQLLDCDFFVFSGHKVFAPTGIGVVYAKPEVLEHMPPWQGGGNMIQDVTFERTLYQPAPQRFEAGTGNIADAVGLGAAIDYVHRAGMENIYRHEHQLLLRATEGLQEIPGLRIIGTAKEKAGVISFVMDGFRTEEIGDYLNRNGIAVRSGHHCAQPILRRFGLESTVRASLALYNTVEDIDALVRAIWNLRLGRVSIE
jgi:cysteine desulfurase/selenocysteine lyase